MSDVKFLHSGEGPKFNIHGRTHLTGIEFSDKIVGNQDEICSTCIFDLIFGESVEKIRYRSGLIISTSYSEELGPASVPV